MNTQSNHRFLLEDIDQVTTLPKVIKLKGKKDINTASFYFQLGNADIFSRNIKIHCEILDVRKNTIQIVKPNLAPKPPMRLADLDNFHYDVSSSYGIRSLVKNIAQAPVDTIWKAGARLGKLKHVQFYIEVY